MKPPGEWGLLGALALEAQPLQVTNVQPARAQQHLRPAQPCRPSCLRPQWLLLPPQAQPWSDGVPRGLLLQRLRRHFLTRCPLLSPSQIKSQGHWGARVQWLVLCRGKERARRAQPSPASPAGGERWLPVPRLLQEHCPPPPTFNQGLCKPQPQGCPYLVSRGHPTQGWSHEGPPSAGACGGTAPRWMCRLCLLSPAHRGFPCALPLWLSIPGLPLAPLLPEAVPLSAAVPHVSGSTHSPPTCTVHRNTDVFAQHPPFAHLHPRKGDKSPGLGTALQAAGAHTHPKTRGPPQPGRAPAAAAPEVAPVLGTLCSGWPQGGSGHLCPQDCPAGLGCQQDSTPGCGHCRDPCGLGGAGRLPWGGRGPWSPWIGGCGPHGPGAMAPVVEELWSP